VCARHIIAAGIKEVIYIEPYPKSMAKDLYRKSICVDDDDDADGDAVRFRPFVGVSPKKFIEFFEMRPRKNRRGLILEWDGAKTVPRIGRIVAYFDPENTIVAMVGELAARLKLQPNATREAEEGADER
jgi:cytidine deaminase